MSSPLIQINVGPTLGALLVGVILGAVFFGITCLQTALYYRTYPKDTTFLKTLVGVLCALDLLSLIFWSHATYAYLVTGYANLAAADSLVWSDAAEPPVTGLIALTVHLFLAWRIQFLDQRWRILSFLITLASFGSFSMVLTGTALEFIGIREGASIPTVTKREEWCTFAGDFSASVIMLTISGSISYLLYRGRGGFSSTNRMLTKLMLYIVTSGAITSILRVLDLILSRAYPGTLYFLIPYISSSKAYVNCLLATLNSRAGRRETFASRSEPIELRNAALDSVNLALKAPQSELEFPKV